MAEDNPEEPGTDKEWAQAVVHGNLHRIQRMLRDGRVDVDRDCIWSGFAALGFLSYNENLRLMRVLLECGADVNHQDKCGVTALHLSVSYCKVNAARLLLEHGADPHIQDAEGRVALHLAGADGKTDLMRLLLEHGADVHARELAGRTPLHTCVFASPFLRAKVDCVRFLLENGSNANDGDDEGNSILWHACSLRHNNEVVRLLLLHGATVTDKDPLSGETLLHVLAKSPIHDGKTMEVLLEHGANPRIRDNVGNLPLDVACARKVDSQDHSARNMNDIYVLFQRMIGDASLSFKQQAPGKWIRRMTGPGTLISIRALLRE